MLRASPVLPNVPEEVAGVDGAVAVEVRVVVPFEAGAEDFHHVAAEAVGADFGHDAARAAKMSTPW